MKKLIILGGGYGGINVAANILHHNFPEDIEIILIDRNPYHALKTEFYATAAGTKANTEVRLNFPDDPRIHYLYKDINHINTESKQIEFKDESASISYDYLVVGLGAVDTYRNVPGAKEYSHSVQTMTNAVKTGASVANTPAHGTIIIVGGGLSGIEVAAEIRVSRQDLNIKLMDRNDAVLRPFDMKIREYVEAWLKKNKVDVVHHCDIEKVLEDGVVSKGETHFSDVTLWTAGVIPNRIVRELPFEKDKQERIIVNEFFQVPEDESIYIVGDCAASEYSPSAQLARAQGQQIAEILLDILHEKEPKEPKPIKLKGTLGSLGRSDGFGNMMDMPMTGWLPRVAKSGVLWLNKRH